MADKFVVELPLHLTIQDTDYLVATDVSGINLEKVQLSDLRTFISDNLEITSAQLQPNSVGAAALENIITAGTVGSSTEIPVITYDENGRITATSTTSITPAGNSFGVITGDTGSANADSNSDTVAITGGTGISTAATNTPDGLVITNTGVTSAVAGTGISVSAGTGAVTITNTDTGSAQNIFKTVTAGGTNLVADSNNDTLTVTAGTGITLSGNAATDTFTITNGGVTSAVAGTGISVSSGTGAVTITNNDRGSAQNIFKTIAVSGQSDVVADSNNDTLTLVAGTGIAITTNATTDSITITSNVSGGATLQNELASTNVFYPTFARSSTGTYSTAYVSNTKFTFVPSSGTVSATNFNSLSDLMYKTNVETLNNSMSVVAKLRGVSFDWKDNGNKSSGVIAQEIENILPHLVEEVDGSKTVNYSGIIGYLIEAIKELDEKVKVLENK